MVHESHWIAPFLSEKSSFFFAPWILLMDHAQHTSRLLSILCQWRMSLILIRVCVTGSRWRIGAKVRIEGTLIRDSMAIPAFLCYWITSRLKVTELKWICLQINARLLQTTAQSMSNYSLNDSAKISEWLGHTIHRVYN